MMMKFLPQHTNVCIGFHLNKCACSWYWFLGTLRLTRSNVPFRLNQGDSMLNKGLCNQSFSSLLLIATSDNIPCSSSEISDLCRWTACVDNWWWIRAAHWLDERIHGRGNWHISFVCSCPPRPCPRPIPPLLFVFQAVRCAVRCWNCSWVIFDPSPITQDHISLISLESLPFISSSS